MHAILASLGTDGDVLPFIGLGVALRARGHRVTIAAAENYADKVAGHWLEFRSLVSAEKMRELLANPYFWHPIKTARFTAAWGTSLIKPQYELFTELAVDKEAVFITNPSILAAQIAHEKTGRPFATVVLQPWLIPSSSAPPVMPLVGLPLWAPPFMHWLIFKMANLAADLLFGPRLNELRREVGLKPMRNLLHNWLAKDLVIGMFPEWFGPPQRDWPQQVRLTGFPLFDATLNRTLPAGLHEFLSNQKPTVVFTFGSGMMHGSQLFEAASRVCAQLNVQGLFINRFQSVSPPPHMFHATFIPFREIFPRCAAIVHHGGIGTTAEALAAGKPQLILPLGFDQLDNGVRVQKLGGGLHTASKHNFVARLQPLRERDVSEIASKLSALLQASMQESAGRFAERVCSENGLDKAADVIEKFVAAR
jgi:rhamnosyltransferase subunit B